MNRFTGQVALVTGGNAGIGRATAIALAAEGAKVVLSGRREREGRAVADEIRRAGGDAIFVQADVARERDVSDLVARTIATFGRLDVAFNNAGVEQTPTPLPEQTEDDFDRIIGIDVKGVWLAMKHEIPAMLRAGGGAIVNTSSAVGLVGIAGAPIYVAAKHAVIGLSKSVALEYARQNVRVNVVAPGAVETRMLEDFTRDPAVRDAVVGGIPMGRTGRPEEIASMVLWLLSGEGAFATGQTFTVDGGYVAQ